jgi:hypothetical protein
LLKTGKGAFCFSSTRERWFVDHGKLAWLTDELGASLCDNVGPLRWEKDGWAT